MMISPEIMRFLPPFLNSVNMRFLLPFLSETMGSFGSTIVALVAAYLTLKYYFPQELQTIIKKLTNLFNPYIKITIDQYNGDGFKRSIGFPQVERYLNANATLHTTLQAKCFKANVFRDSPNIIVTMGQKEKVIDVYQGIKLQWISSNHQPNRQSISLYPHREEKKFFVLKYHKRHHDMVMNKYLKHVFDEGKAIQARERYRKLYTNYTTNGDSKNSKLWTDVMFRHPATFDTLAMDPAKKKEIMDDLINFSKAKDYYAKIGKAWKRGYLLYGPPGTGKSTTIAAVANLLKYDVYDLELTAVKDNTELRKLLINTSNKAIIVIEDIDCSLDLTGHREKKKDEEGDLEGQNKEKVETVIKKCTGETEKDKSKQVTLSGLLNFIDGLWSSSGEERIFVFTTNHIEKLDPALIRSGRMDKHIELSYCGFEAFKCLARNYLDIESHELFPRIKELLEEIKISPADVAEKLTPKSFDEDKESCLMRLLKALGDAKVEETKQIIGAETDLAREEQQEKLAKED